MLNISFVLLFDSISCSTFSVHTYILTPRGTVRGKKTGTAKKIGRAGKQKVSCLVSVTNPKGKSRSLVLYFSHSGTTKKVAQRIKNRTNADILRIVERDKYPSDYEKTTKRAVREIKKKAIRQSARRLWIWTNTIRFILAFLKWSMVFQCVYSAYS